MRKILSLSAIIVLVSSIGATLAAQDIIITKKAEEVEAKVLEVGEGEVKYKKHSNPQGPTYIMPMSEIFMIKYENGEKDVFRNEEQPAPQEPQTTAATLQPTPAPAAPALSEIASINPWAGKAKFGVRTQGGLSALFLSGGGKKENGFGYNVGGYVYLDYNLKSRSGWLLGLAAGFRHTDYSFSENYTTPIHQTLGSVDIDLYAGGASGYRFDPFSSSFTRRASIFTTRYGLRVRIPAYAKLAGMDAKELFNPAQVGIFVDFLWHYGGFGVGFDMDFMFSNLYKANERVWNVSKMSSMSYSLGLLLEYSF